MPISDVLFQYLKNKFPNFSKTKKLGSHLFTCPNLKNHAFPDDDPTATIMPGTEKIACLVCDFKNSVFGAVRLLEPDKRALSDAEILEYLIKSLNLDMYKELDIYKSYGFSLVPLSPKEKNPIEKGWTEKTHYEKEDWVRWLQNGYNIGLRTGEVSKITVFDFDSYKIKEWTEDFKQLKDLLEKSDTLKDLSARGGNHYIFQYDKDLPNRPIELSSYHIDIENDGGQIVIQPSTFEGKPYKWLNPGATIKSIPPELKEKIMSLIKEPRPKEKTDVPDIQVEGGVRTLAEGEGRNDLLVKLGGALINKTTGDTTAYVMNLINKVFFKPPLSGLEIQNMLGSLQGYKSEESATIEKQIYEYMKIMQTGISCDDVVKHVFNGDKTKNGVVYKYLSQFIKEGKATRPRSGRYQIKDKIEWLDNIPLGGRTCPFKIPYFEELQDYEEGDIILLGAKPGYGKTTIAMNILAQIASQGAKPFYVYSESGSRFLKTAKQLGLIDEKEKSKFYHSFHSSPTSIEIEPNAFTVLDWLMVAEKENSVEENTPILIRKNGIKEIVPIHDLDIYHDYKAIDIWTEQGWTQLFKVIKHKVNKKMYRIITKESIIECTEDHSLMIKGKEIKPSSLTIGDKIELIDFPYEHDLNIDIDWAWLQGFISAEGTIPRYYNYKNRTNKRISSFTITNTNTELLKKCQRILEKFGILSVIKDYPGNQKINTKHVYVLILKGRAERICEQFNIWHINKDGTKKVPYFILNANLLAKQSYFDGYMAGDGNIDNNGRGRFATIDKSLFTGICYLLKSLKKNFSVDFKSAPNQNSHDRYSVAINKGKQYVLDRPNNIVRKIEIYNIKDYVYDLSTKNHTFTGGCGCLVNLHNTDSIIKYFNDEMQRRGGILIIMSQLKDDYQWFAPNLIKQFPALAAKLIYEDDSGTTSHWQIDKIRDAKQGGGNLIVPCEYNRETRILTQKKII